MDNKELLRELAQRIHQEEISFAFNDCKHSREFQISGNGDDDKEIMLKFPFDENNKVIGKLIIRKET